MRAILVFTVSMTAMVGVNATTILLDFGVNSAAGGSVYGPGHTGQTAGGVIPTGQNSWNSVNGTDGGTVSDLASGSVNDASGATLPGVSVNFGVGTLSGMDYGVQPFVRVGFNGSRSGDGVFANTTFADFMASTNTNGADTVVGMAISGLAADTYQVWVVSRHTYINNDAMASDEYTIHVGAGGLVTAPNTLSSSSIQQYSRANASANTGGWAVGEGYTWRRMEVNLGVGEDLLVFSESTFDNQNGVINAVMVSSIPEPGTLMLVGVAMGGMMVLGRRRGGEIHQPEGRGDSARG